MPVRATDAQSLEKDHRSAGEHLKSSTKESEPLQTVYQLHQGPNLKVSVQLRVLWDKALEGRGA